MFTGADGLEGGDRWDWEGPSVIVSCPFIKMVSMETGTRLILGEAERENEGRRCLKEALGTFMFGRRTASLSKRCKASSEETLDKVNFGDSAPMLEPLFFVGIEKPRDIFLAGTPTRFISGEGFITSSSAEEPLFASMISKGPCFCASTMMSCCCRYLSTSFFFLDECLLSSPPLGLPVLLIVGSSILGSSGSSSDSLDDPEAQRVKRENSCKATNDLDDICLQSAGPVTVIDDLLTSAGGTQLRACCFVDLEVISLGDQALPGLSIDGLSILTLDTGNGSVVFFLLA